MDKRKRILRERAIEAAKKVDVIEAEEYIDVVCFKIGNEEYAIETTIVSEVNRYTIITPVPHTPSYINGIFYLRGRFISIVDLKHFLGIEGESLAKSQSILLLSDNKIEVGIVVDEVLEETTLLKKSIQTIPIGFDLDRKEIISGVTEEGIILIDSKNFLCNPGMVVHQEVTNSFIRREDV